MLFITVLKSGGVYNQDHVEALYDEFLEYAPDGVDFVCLSDLPGVPGYYPLVCNYPGWWSKIEVFNFDGPWLYVDLDTVLVGDISDHLSVAENNWFTVLRDFNPHQRLLGTGVMGYGGKSKGFPLYKLADKFSQNPKHWQHLCRTPHNWGDQGFVEGAIKGWKCEGDLKFWQQELPGTVVSYKKDILKTGKSDLQRIVCFHGEPRPWQTSIRSGR